MTQWLAGMRMTADRLNDHSELDSTTTGLEPATGFVVNSFSGRRRSGITTVHCYVQLTGSALTAPSGSTNMNDTLMCTLPEGWWPPEVINAVWGTGTETGECTLGTSGQITLRSSAFVPVPSGRNFHVTSTWITAP